MIFEQMDVRTAADDLFQCLLHDVPGGVCGMNDAPLAVTAFTGQVITRLGRCVFGKGNALIDQPVDGFATVFDDETGRFFITQPGAGCHGIGHVFFNTVQNRVQYGGNAALCEIAGAFP